MDGLDILFADVKTLVDKALGVFCIFVRAGHLEPILTKVHSLLSTLQVLLHELDPRNQAVRDSGEVLMSLEVGGNAPRGHFVSLLIQDLPVCLIRMHGCTIPMGHRLEGLVFVVERWFCINIHDVWHCIDGGPHGIGGNAPILEVSYPFWKDKITFFIGNSGVGGASIVVGFKAVGARVHVV